MAPKQGSRKGGLKKGSKEAKAAMAGLRSGKAVYAKGSQAAKDAMAAARAARGNPKPLSRKAAVRAFNKKYSSKNYKTEQGRKAAITRKMCDATKPVVTDARYRRSVKKYSYKGLDDGSNCPTGNVKRSKRAISAAQRAALAKGQAALAARRQSGGSRRQNSRRQNKAVSLKTAVGLLRNYYRQRYGQ